jgi:hypothetical protein
VQKQGKSDVNNQQQTQQLPLWHPVPQFDIRGLLRGLKHNDAHIRRRAAAMLGVMGMAAAVGELQAALRKEADKQVQETIQTALATLTGERAALADSMIITEDAHLDHETRVKRMIKQLESDNTEAVVEAATALGELGDKLAVEPLVFLFRNAKVSIQVRLAVAEALLKLESAPVEVTLLATLRHNDWHIRRNGAAILGQLKAEWAIEPLARALQDPHGTVQRTARAALRHIGTPEARRALATRSSNDNVSPVRSVTTHPDDAAQDQGLRPPNGGILRRVQGPQEQAADYEENKATGTAAPPDPDATIYARKQVIDTAPLDEDKVSGDKSLVDTDKLPATRLLDAEGSEQHSAPTQPLRDQAKATDESSQSSNPDADKNQNDR